MVKGFFIGFAVGIVFCIAVRIACRKIWGIDSIDFDEHDTWRDKD